jgi:hypothetical protein
VEKYVSFLGDTANDPKNFTVEVQRGDTIDWIGVPKQGSPLGHYVLMKLIRYKGGDRVLRGNGENRNPPNNPVVVRAQVKSKKNVIGKEEIYIIHFQVFKDGKPSGMYILDPKLKVIRD